MYHLKCEKLRELSDPKCGKEREVPIIACVHAPDISAQCDVIPIDIYVQQPEK